MSKTRASFLALAALVIGAVVGGWGVSKFWGRFTGDLSAGSMAAEASTTVSILKRLRAGDLTNAVELLEIELDGALIGLGVFLPDIPEAHREPLHLKVIRTARDYRAHFPRTNESDESAEAVARAFTLLDGKTRH